MSRLLDRVLGWEGSTRQIAILRFAMGLIIWAEYAQKHAAFRNHAPGDLLFGAVLVTAAGCMAFGLFSRVATAVSALCMVYGYHYLGVHLGQKEPFVHAHTYVLMCTVVFLAMMPTGRSLSVDRWWALRREERGGPAPVPEWAPLWPLALIRLQLALVYFWGAIDKTNVAFLSGSRLQQMYYYYYGSHEGVRLPFFDELMTLGGIATVVLEYGLAFGLWFAPARKWLIPAGIIFHLMIYLSFPVGTFSVTSCVLYFAFFAPATVHAWFGRMAPADTSV
ncbi:MAG: HTTM domain-containing protein [Deltaproteobacteria bacterium]|nr:HTTM domain-containing protein [Deltaproteobacteria bacterium]